MHKVTSIEGHEKIKFSHSPLFAKVVCLRLLQQQLISTYSPRRAVLLFVRYINYLLHFVIKLVTHNTMFSNIEDVLP